MDDAHERLEVARLGVGAGIAAPVVGAAYSAAFDAAQAALSEEDRFARRHSGVWALFGETFVATGRLDGALYADIHAVRELREAAEQESASLSLEQARAALATCERFVAAIEAMLGG